MVNLRSSNTQYPPKWQKYSTAHVDIWRLMGRVCLCGRGTYMYPIYVGYTHRRRVALCILSYRILSSYIYIRSEIETIFLFIFLLFLSI